MCRYKFVDGLHPYSLSYHIQCIANCQYGKLFTVRVRNISMFGYSGNWCLFCFPLSLHYCNPVCVCVCIYVYDSTLIFFSVHFSWLRFGSFAAKVFFPVMLDVLFSKLHTLWLWSRKIVEFVQCLWWWCNGTDHNSTQAHNHCWVSV